MLYSLHHQRHEVVCSACAFSDGRKQRLHFRVIAAGAEPGQFFGLELADAVVDPENLGIGFLFDNEFIYAHDDLLVALNFLLVLISAPCDLVLDEALFDGAYGAAHGVYLMHELPGAFFHFFGEGFHIVGAGQRVYRIGDAAFVPDDLLRSQGDAGGGFGREEMASS